MNKVMISGHLCAEPEIYDGKDFITAKYTLGIRRNSDESDFIRCVAFNKSAEFAEEYLKKGMKIIVIGHIQTGKYTNKDGQDVYTTDVIVESQEFCEKKEDGKNKKGGRR